MKEYFICSLCHYGILGGVMIVDEKSVTYKTGKLTVENRYRNLCLDRKEIGTISWNRVVFPVVTFNMKNGETFKFLIFNKHRFERAYGQQQY